MAIYAKTADGWTEIGASEGGGSGSGAMAWGKFNSVPAGYTETGDWGPDAQGRTWKYYEFADEGDFEIDLSGGQYWVLAVGGGDGGQSAQPTYENQGQPGLVNEGYWEFATGATPITVGKKGTGNSGFNVANMGQPSFIGAYGTQGAVGFGNFMMGRGAQDYNDRTGYHSTITGTSLQYAPGNSGPDRPGRPGNRDNASQTDGCVIIATVTNDETDWNPPGSLPGIGGWATITEVKGKGTKYEYGDWVAFEWTDDGSVATSGGLVDAFVLSGGSSFFQYAGADVYGNGGQHLVGLKNLDVGDNEVVIGAGGIHQYNGSRTATWGKPSSIGPVASADTFSGSGLENNIVTNDYTGSDKTYGQDSGASNAPANSGNYGTKNAGSGVVIIRVPKSSDNSGLPAGAFDEPVTLAPGLEGAGPEVPEAPEPEEGGALFSRTYTLNSDPSTEPGLVYPSTSYIKLNREDALVWQENVEDGVDILCELLPDGGYPGYRRRYFNLYYYVPQTGSSKLKFYDGYDGSIPSYVDKSYTVTAYPAGQIPDDETLDAASAQAAAVEARESVKTKRKKKK